MHQDKEKLESLNHLNSTFQFKQACQQRIHDIDKQIKNIQHNIKRYARPKRLAAIRKLPCVKCGGGPSQAAHSNFGEHGKGKGIKADDKYTIPLCHSCHGDFDKYKTMGREESKEWFAEMLEKTERMLNLDKDDCF